MTLIQRMVAVSLAVLALMGWLVMIVFAVIPKGLTLMDLLFLYFVIVIATITLFTTLDVNLHWAPLTRKVEGSFAMYICRFIFIPVLTLLGACVLVSGLKVKWRAALTVLIVLVLTGADLVYLWFDLIEFKKWNSFYSFLMYGGFILLIGWIARWYRDLDKGVAGQS